MSVARLCKAGAYICALVCVSVALAGCQNAEKPTTTSAPTTTEANTTSTSTLPPSPTTTTTTLAQATNIWQWRSDMEMSPQIDYDLSTNLQHSIYGGCWREFQPQTLAGGQYIQYGPAEDQFIEDNKTYGTYDGEAGITLFNLRKDPAVRGCLMRKSRLPIDLSKIGRLELDMESSGGNGRAPWYSVWLTPMLYSDTDDNAKAAEIDLVENYDWQKRGSDVNSVQSSFAQCGVVGYTKRWCTPSYWGSVATTLNHHITLKVENSTECRVIRVYRCSNSADSKVSTCPNGSSYAEIKVDKAPPAGVQKGKWFPIWNKDVAGKHYAHYWLVADMWWTSNTDFKLKIDNVKFFQNDDTEWRMELNGPRPSELFTRKSTQTLASVIV